MSPIESTGGTRRPTPQITAVVLAAGSSRRMGLRNKLLVEIAGRPIIAHTLDAVIGSGATPAIVVTGYQRTALERALRGRRVRFVHNAAYRKGLSTSLHRGLAALGMHADAALICLADMPLLTSADIDHIIAAFRRETHQAVCVPTFEGRRGHPIIFPRTFFTDLQGLAGDVGARHWLSANRHHVHHIEMRTNAVLIDIDSPRALNAIRRRLSTAGSEGGPIRGISCASRQRPA